MLKKLFKKPIQEKTMTETHETHVDQARAKVQETIKKIDDCELALADSEKAYQAALKNADDKSCLALLEQQDVTRRNLRLYNDQLPLHRERIREAEKLDATPEIVAMCIEAQKLCDIEKQLIDAYVLACDEFKNATEALVQHSHKTNQALRVLKHEIERVGNTPRPAVDRAPFKKPEYVIEHGRQIFPHFSERSITDYKNYSEAES